MKATLSTSQWQRLQALFEQAAQLDRAATDALMAAVRMEDALVADALNAVLAAHQRWDGHTDDAIGSLADTAKPSATGTRLGAYRLVAEIGRGGMGVVYRGEREDGQVQQQVAIKVLHAHSLDANTRARFQREREILASFDHPGIARLLDAGESDGNEPYYVMEYLRGSPITTHCDERQFTIRERLRLFVAICEAVQYAHGKLILHRDIKSNNVLVDASGTPKLIDFGIAKPLHLADATAVDETAAHQRYFSPVNAAPEQVRGERVAVTCDVYQLGTLLHELLCGKQILVLAGLSAAGIEQRICEDAPPLPSTVAALAAPDVVRKRGMSTSRSLARQLRGDLDAIVQRATRKEPDQRYASVEQLAQDVERYLTNQPVLGRRGNNAYRVGRFIKRHWRSLSFSVAASVAMVVFTALLLGQVKETRLERDHAVAEGKRAEAVTEFLLDIFHGGDPATALKPDTPISVVLERGHKSLQRRLEGDPRTASKLLGTLAGIHIGLGDLETAESLGNQSLHMIENRPDPDLVLLAEQYQMAAATLFHRARIAEATKMAQQSIDTWRRAGHGVEKSWYSKILLARIQMRTDEEGGCREIDTLAAQMRAFTKVEPVGFASAQDATTICGPQTPERLAQNERDLREAVTVVSTQLSPDHSTAIIVKRQLAMVLQRQKRLDEADALQHELLVQQERIYGKESWSVAYSLAGLGMSAYDRKRYDESETYFLRAEEIIKRVHKDRPHADLATLAYHRARIADFGHDDKPKAQALYARAVEIGREGWGPESLNVGLYCGNYGTLLQRLGDPGKAEPLLRTAVQNVPASRTNGARARVSLATILVARKQFAEAAALLSAAEAGLVDASDEDSRLAPQVTALRSALVKTAVKPSTQP